ncbi:MAG: hypothetical protein ABMB14_33005 [Myxococcota bacterium]
MESTSDGEPVFAYTWEYETGCRPAVVSGGLALLPPETTAYEDGRPSRSERVTTTWTCGP